MRKAILFLLGSLLLIGCASDGATDVGGRPLTIFGRLSQLVQLGRTEETLAYKLQSDSFFVTANGEVLMNRPAYIDIRVTDRETGLVREDVTVHLLTCNAQDDEVFGVDSCNLAEAGEPLHTLEQTATLQNGVYRVDGFEWARSGDWRMIFTIESADSAEAETLTFYASIYPQRPPSSNTFELTNITLPFIVVALFFAVLRWRGGGLLQPAPIAVSHD